MVRKITLAICSVIASLGITLFVTGFSLIASAGWLAMMVED